MITVCHCNLDAVEIATEIAIKRGSDNSKGLALFAALVAKGLYAPVAHLEPGTFVDAHRATNHGGRVWDEQQANGVTVLPAPHGHRHRSTSIGDILLQDGIGYLVDRKGYTQLGPITI